MKLGFIGTGVISEAIINGLLNSDFPVSEVVVSARNRAISAQLADKYSKVRISEDNQDIIESSDLVFLAVRPQDAETVVSPLRFREGQQIVSLIATLPIEKIQEWTGPSAVITRAIPLPFVSERTGVTAIYPNSEVLTTLFASIGTVVVAKTSEEFDAFAVASASMGTYFGIMDTVAQWLCSKGTDYADASAYVSAMFLELAKTGARSQGGTFEDLRLAHSTPNGLNQQLFDTFSVQGGRQALLDALDVVADRIRQAR